jgi:hypothetical protein
VDSTRPPSRRATGSSARFIEKPFNAESIASGRLCAIAAVDDLRDLALTPASGI